ncbi:GtrA family protein [Segatella maculosa]|uniref:GtrA family protein n=1 Tax=Segatella maculosa TaxID=439703 RepID=UPI0023F1B85E|nr:GtrA family protein [Segatella maculosa]
MKLITNPLEPKHKQQIGEIVRFGIVGGVATLIQYGVYLLMLYAVSPTLSNTIGYAVSFLFNFVASTRYTFKVKTNARHGAGFALSHLINYGLQIVMLHLFMALGFSEKLAPVPMFCVCVPINFLLVRFFLKR